MEHRRHVSTGGERVPQWSEEETREFLVIRAELDRSFARTKRNKPLWESISARMRLRGFARTPDQCKSKWKNLVTRFKAHEAQQGRPSSAARFPFADEMRAIFSDRTMANLLTKLDEGSSDDDKDTSTKTKRKKKEGSGGVVEAVVREVTGRQKEMEGRLAAAAEAREVERRGEEEEWRGMMRRLEEEREEMERRWREREEGRRAREEARGEARDALVTALLNKLIRDVDDSDSFG